MIRPSTLRKVPTADGFDTLYSTQYEQTYHSTHGAAQEARHVFVEGAGVSGRLALHRSARVLEIGFGTGLNFLLTAQEASALSARLHYTALEKALPPADLLADLNHGAKLHMPEHSTALVLRNTWLPSAAPRGRYRHAFGARCMLELIVGDATLATIPQPGYDAVYLDAFSPKTNPELWTLSFLTRLFDATSPGGRIATYSAAAQVRRSLAEVGFTVLRRAGPPGKREMLVGLKPTP